ncbi:MAG: hypothetical protein ISR77_09915 [Pirellulaceae bacterium]|nr:hypothetical protein [Pirellulaceae bacterium]
MKRHKIRIAALLVACVVSISPNAIAEVPMIHLAGTPEEIGTKWGRINKEIILRDLDAAYLKPAAAAGISKETLIERSAAYVRIAAKIAPHWLEQTGAIARAVDVPEDLFLAFYGGLSRKRFLHECTSYAVSRDRTRDGVILFHKTRDNVARPQAVCIMDSSLEGINKFIGVTDVSFLDGLSMMVNEKGLAGAGDYPANRKKDSSTLHLEPAEPRYRGLSGGAILRHIAERASSSAEALAIIEDFVAKGYYSGGKVGGKHWLFVDREGVILEVCSNEKYVASKMHSKTVYFSRLNRSAAAKRLREAGGPVDFHLFHNVARDPSICLGSSISGMTVEIDPTHPELFTCAWVSLPVKAVSFPLLMGQTSTPACLLNGEAYSLGTKTKRNTRLWEDTEQRMRASKELLKEKIAAELPADDSEKTAQALNKWSELQAGMLIELLQESR